MPIETVIRKIAQTSANRIFKVCDWHLWLPVTRITFVWLVHMWMQVTFNCRFTEKDAHHIKGNMMMTGSTSCATVPCSHILYLIV